MGKFSKTLEKGQSYRDSTNVDESWLEPAPDNGLAIDSAADSRNSAIDNNDTPTGKWDERLFKAVNEDASLPEIFKVLRTRILHPQKDNREIKTVMVTSAVPNEGKSFITANLGISLAQDMDQHSLIVDCDLRRPSLAKLLGCGHTSGLVDYLREDLDLPQAITKTATNKLSLLPSGKPPINPSELLSSVRMKNLIDELSTRYNDRVIIFDTPPAMVAAETGVLAGLVDTVLLVVRQGVAKKADIQKTIDTIGENKILGIVYNDQIDNAFSRPYSKNHSYYRH